jgi:hypothetical protein
MRDLQKLSRLPPISSALLATTRRPVWHAMTNMNGKESFQQITTVLKME